MKQGLLYLFALGLGGLSAAEIQPSTGYLTGVAPAWVETREVPALDVARETSQGSIHYLLVDEQSHAGEETEFYHYAYKVLTEAGLEEAASISLSFDPSYQTLTYHRLRRYRDGEWKDLLGETEMQVLQREKDMESSLLDGSLTVSCNLKDIRVGDVLDYSFSRKGAHPLLKGKFVDSNSLSWGVPVEEMFIRVLMPKARKLQGRFYLDAGQMEVKELEDVVEYRVQRAKVPAVLSEKDVPSWVDQYAWVQWSEFGAWSEVVEWALPLYPEVTELSDDLKAKVELLARETLEEVRVLKALQMAQAEIRYLGIHLGVGSHRPNPPDLVLSRRFGDCKDKTQLLVTVLRALGIKAYPALVDTDDRRSITTRLPSPYCFDHVITLVVLEDGTELWLDPTRRPQYGKLRELYVGNYERALVIKPGETELRTYEPRPASLPRTTVNEEFSVGRPEALSGLSVHTVYEGLAAEYARNNFAQRSETEAQKYATEYYGKIFPKIKSVAAIRVQDDKERNRVEVWESYEITELWETQKEGGWSLEFYPYEIKDQLTETGSLDRRMPLDLNYPEHFMVNTKVTLFEPWNLTPERVDLKTRHVRYEHEIAIKSNVITMTYDYESVSPFVELKDLVNYHDTLKQVKDSLGYTLTYNPSLETVKKVTAMDQVNFLMVLVTLACLFLFGLAGLLFWFLSKLNPPRPKNLQDADLEGLGGWLILVAVGLFLRPVTLVSGFFSDLGLVYNMERWAALTSPEGGAYHPMFAPLLYFEVVANLFLIMLGLLLILLFFTKRASFPWVFILMLALLPLVHVLDFVLSQNIPAVASQNREAQFSMTLWQNFAQAAIWIPYALKSRRVRVTFRY
ncbi:MAG: DUF3857 domain-containing protein [Blastochloris sp.]|nr:DUF3857 domain-containing protein [Blastochloris sp.]